MRTHEDRTWRFKSRRNGREKRKYGRYQERVLYRILVVRGNGRDNENREKKILTEKSLFRRETDMSKKGDTDVSKRCDADMRKKGDTDMSSLGDTDYKIRKN